MPFQEMKISGAWIHKPIRHSDGRGHFEEQFKLSQIQSQIGRSFVVRQVNQSASTRGVIRGIHYNESTEGQAKYVSCSRGRIWDVVVDLRAGSPTYGLWDATELSPENGASLFISEGLGHAFLSLEDDTIVTYLCTSEYNPTEERTLNPFSKNLGVDFYQFDINKFELSGRDLNAPEF